MNSHDFLGQCDGIETETRMNAYGGTIKNFHAVKDIITPPDDVFVKINATATAGTIGKVVGVETKFYSNRRRVYPGNTTLLFEVDGRDKPGRINIGYVEFLPGYAGQTVWNYNVQQHAKKKVETPVNKFKQEFKKGLWCIGNGQGYKRNKILVGRVSRWTNHNVWINVDVEGSDKSKEFQLANYHESFIFPDEEMITEELVMATFRGWEGN